MTSRVTPVARDDVLSAFVKLLAPRPVVYVFRALSGWQYAATEMPDTYQVVLGVSAELWYYIRNRVMYDTGRNVADYVELRHVHEGNRMVLHLAPTPSVEVREYGPDAWAAPLTLEIAPKPIARPDGAA